MSDPTPVSFSDHGRGRAPYRDETLKRLEFAIRRDGAKGGAGLRTTSDVAGWHGVPTKRAAALLEAMERAGDVECAGKTAAGRWWKITDAGRAALQGVSS